MSDDPIHRLESEHDEALQVLDRLERAVAGLEAGEPPAPLLDIAREAHTALSTTVRRHNEDEERALFPLLGEDAPVEQFIAEHRTLRLLEQALQRALEGPGAARTVPEIARDILALLRAHIERENQALFPLAREHLGAGGLARVARLLAEG